MDRESRQLFRNLVQRGDLVDFMLNTLDELNQEDAWRVFVNARFHVERVRKVYGIRGKMVAVCWLSDDAIIDLINSPQGRRCRRDWAAGYRHDTDRKVIDLIIEEAEYRGLKSRDQLRWEEMRDASPEGRSGLIGRSLASGTCLERGGHKFLFVKGEHICANCRSVITDEEVMVRVNRECAGRLRLPRC